MKTWLICKYNKCDHNININSINELLLTKSRNNNRVFGESIIYIRLIKHCKNIKLKLKKYKTINERYV